MGTENKILKLKFSDLFDIKEIQRLQDSFAKALGVASMITDPDGYPITEPSNFCELCNDIIRKTEKGLINCMKSDSVIGKYNPNGPTISPCLSGGLLDAGTSIRVENTHIANWLIGQVRDESADTDKVMEYARKIGADEEKFLSAWNKVPSMPIERFSEIADALFLMSDIMSRTAYQNMRQKELTMKLEQEIRDREIRRLVEEKNERIEKYMIFCSGNEEYGIPVIKIQEVIMTIPFTPVPHTPDYMKGVINLRGKVIPIIDFRIKMGLDAVNRHDKSCIIIIHSEKQLMGLIVDSIAEVSGIKGKNIEDMPINSSTQKTAGFVGVAKNEGKMILLLNIDHFLDSEEMDMRKRQIDRAM